MNIKKIIFTSLSAVLLAAAGCGVAAEPKVTMISPIPAEPTVAEATPKATLYEPVPTVAAPEPTKTLEPTPSPMPSQTAKPSKAPETSPKQTKRPQPSPSPTERPRKPGIYNLEANKPFDYDVDADGENEAILCQKDGEDLLVSVNGGEALSIRRGAPADIRLYHVKDTVVLLVSYDPFSDDDTTLVMGFEENAVVETDIKGGRVEKIKNDVLTFNVATYTLGTYMGTRDYVLTEARELQPAGDGLFHYSKEHQWYKKLIVSKELPVALMDQGEYKPGTLSPGTSLLPLSTDEQTVVFFEQEDGTKGRLEITREDAFVQIQGSSDEEWFSNISYFG